MFLIFFFPLFLNAQEHALFDSIKVSKSTKLLGFSKTYETFNFCIENKNEIDSLTKILVYGDVTGNYVELNSGFNIKLIEENRVIKSWVVNPKFSNIIIDGQYYKFDFDVIRNIAKKFYFKYNLVKMQFKTIQEYDLYLQSLKSNPNFLFSYKPDFKFQGSFEIEFPGNDEFSSPKAICDYINPEILKIVENKDKYRITYGLTDYNLKHPKQFTMRIECERIVYEKLNLKGLKNMNWLDNMPSGIFYFKK